MVEFVGLICISILTECSHFEETTKMSLEKLSFRGGADPGVLGLFVVNDHIKPDIKKCY